MSYDRLKRVERVIELENRISELEAAIAWANNSLFGSHGFFLSLDGGPANEHHLDTAIEKLKEQARKPYKDVAARITELEAERDELVFSRDSWRNVAQANAKSWLEYQTRATKAEAERDRLKAAMERIAHHTSDTATGYMARAALSGEGVT